MTNRVAFFYVQHLLGVGHVYRATRIAKGLANAGWTVHLVWGGTRLPGFDFDGINVHYLTPVRAGDAGFANLLHGDGREFSNADKEARKEELLALFDETAPNVLMTEAFPFGRRQMLFELVPLLERAKARSSPPKIVASIRDIMQEGRKPSRVQDSCDFVKNYFDLILVHGDPKLIRIEETLQGAGEFLDKVRYTGLVTPPETQINQDLPAVYDVLVSVGGGAFGKELLQTAIETHSRMPEDKSNWLVTTGTELAEADFEAVSKNAASGLKIVRHIDDLVIAMKQASVSVSHAGYNTVGDILRAGCASVLFPHVGGRETEQLRRARMMDELGIAQCLEPEQFSPQTLERAILKAFEKSAPSVKLDLDGANGTEVVLSKALN